MSNTSSIENKLIMNKEFKSSVNNNTDSPFVLSKSIKSYFSPISNHEKSNSLPKVVKYQ